VTQQRILTIYRKTSKELSDREITTPKSIHPNVARMKKLNSRRLLWSKDDPVTNIHVTVETLFSAFMPKAPI
jgi:hypothetical protein